VNTASLVEKISELSRQRRIDGISEIRDETNREGPRDEPEEPRGPVRPRGARRAGGARARSA